MRGNVTRGLLIGVATGVAAAAVTELLRPRGRGPARVIDWEEVRLLAERRLPGEAPLTPERRTALEAGYTEFASEMRPHLFEAVGESRPLELPSFEALDRPRWLEVNIGILARVIDPLVASSDLPDNLLVDVGRAGVDRYAALLLGFLATRVLGQFDPQLMGREPVEHGRHALYLVEPNVQRWQDEAGLPGDDLRRWLILHEMTHAWQFAAHPWLEGHINSALDEMLALGGHRGAAARLMGLAVGLPSQWSLLRRMQATMSLVEGYSNLVMNLAGRRVLASFDELERAYRRRQRQRNPLEDLFWKVTGLELKMQQYRRGEQFAQRVYDAQGMAVLNLAWERAENLPTLAELDRPDRWVARVTARERPALEGARAG